MQQEVLRMLTEAQDNGATVFFSSHIISEVQTVANRVAVIREGKIVEVAETASLLNRSMRQVRIRFQQPTEAEELYKLPGVELIAKDDGLGVLLQVEGAMDALIKTLAKYPVNDFETERASLEEIFLAYYKGEEDK
jgi:ABC-2 type transport system ATP-binding protein